MDIFISWSGNKSKTVALLLQELIASTIQSVDPFVSANSNEMGTSWVNQLLLELEQTDLGIICLTASNMKSPWVLFESGAMATKKSLIPLCIDFKPSKLKDPLSLFQGIELKKEDIKNLLLKINGQLKQGIGMNKLESAFEREWMTFHSNIVSRKIIPKENRPLPAIEDARKRLRSSKVLLIEDRMEFSDLIIGQLEASGAEVTLAKSMVEALQAANGQQEFNLVVLDLYLPIEHGGRDYENMGSYLIPILKALLGKIPVISLSNYISNHEVLNYPMFEEVLRKKDFIAKHGGIDQLIQVLSKHL